MPEQKALVDTIGETVLIDATGFGRFQSEAQTGSSNFLIDEPIAVGGLGSGPNPYDLLVSALGACTLMTVRLYANHKNWPLDRIRVRVTRCLGALKARDTFATEILLEGPLDEGQRSRLIEIAGHCPVHRTLERGVDFTATQIPASALFSEARSGTCDHVQSMEAMQDSYEGS